MNNLSSVDILVKEIEVEIAKGITEEISEMKNKKYIEYLEYLSNIQCKLALSKYKMVFIGDKGIGKTTTILELFGLVRDNKDDLLTTASGGTTTCEVEILESNTDYSFFEIVPLLDSIMEQFVFDFCQSYNEEETEDKSPDVQYLPTEIARSIRKKLP